MKPVQKAHSKYEERRKQEKEEEKKQRWREAKLAEIQKQAAVLEQAQKKQENLSEKEEFICRREQAWYWVWVNLEDVGKCRKRRYLLKWGTS